MNSNGVFKAPWGRSLKVMTTIFVCILVGIPIIASLNRPDIENIGFYIIIIFPLVILFGAAFFMIRGYEISKDKLFIQRLCWNTVIDLNQFQTAEVNPDAMKKSIRTFGNGGLFSFTGKFRNKQLGSYRAFVTNPELAVILTFTDKVIVVTPDNPGIFAEQIRIISKTK